MSAAGEYIAIVATPVPEATRQSMQYYQVPCADLRSKFSTQFGFVPTQSRIVNRLVASISRSM